MNMKNIPENARPIVLKPDELPEELKKLLMAAAPESKRFVSFETFDAMRDDLMAVASLLDSVMSLGGVLRVHPEAAPVVDGIYASYQKIMNGMLAKWGVVGISQD